MPLHWHDPEAVPTEPPPDLKGARHASRQALERVLLDPGDERGWAFLAETYAEMAAEWPEWAQSQQQWYDAPVQSGLRRVGTVPWAVEVGCGTGEATPRIVEHASRTVATDVNEGMLALVPRLPGVDYVLTDVRAMPLRDGSVPLLVGLNAVPHIHEFRRVVASGGRLLWCTSFGSGTPLYVEPERLLALLGPEWSGEAGRAGHGEWMLLRRDA